MQKARALALLSLSLACITPAFAQGMMEGTFVRGLGAGMGAGTAASLGKGKTVRRTYESMLQAQQAMLAQTKAIEQYVAAGAQLEAKKQWTNAEQYFQYALQMIAKRDGPGSPKSVPVLEHLAKINKDQKKLDQAIGYQKTVVAFANRAAQQNPAAAVQAQNFLSSMYIDKGDFTNAEGVLKQSTDIVRKDRSINPQTYTSTLKVYGVVLRKLNKTAEADQVDAELATQSTDGTSTTAQTATPAHSNSPVVTATPPAVPGDAGSANTSATSTTNSAAVDPTTAAGSALPETAPSAAANSSSASVPVSVPLPPPTADWPVIGSDGKISSEPAPKVQPPAETTAQTAPQTTPAATTVAPSEAPVAPAAAPVVEPAQTAPKEVPSADKPQAE